MKKGFLLFILSSICFSLFAQDYQLCHIGFKFEISTSKSWGYGKPVVLSVNAASPADLTNIKPADIIESVNDVETYGKTIEEVYGLLNQTNDLKLVTSNLKEKNKAIFFTKKCNIANAIDEEELASAYVFYSLENNGLRSFICPFKTTITEEKDLGKYKTFGFSPIDESNKNLEEFINKQIKKSLEAKGLVYDSDEPDLVIQTYYQLGKNPNYLPKESNYKYSTEFRYDVHSQKIVNLPIYYSALIKESQVEYQLNFGIKIIDRYAAIALWECEAKESLSAPYKLEDYAYLHIPLMFMQYPYAKTTNIARYLLSQQKYNYTGINYNINRINEIIAIDPYSPATSVAIQAGDIIEKIDDKKMKKSPGDFSVAYRRFIRETMSFRDEKTKFTDAGGYTNCMYWDKVQYPKIADAFKKPEYMTGFAYLFSFEPYVNLSGSNIVTFSVLRGKDKLDVKIQPEIRERRSFETF